MELTSENVTKIFEDCLFKDGEKVENVKFAEGIMNNFGFNPDRLEQHENDIYSMLKKLPAAFQKDGGGGMSFLNACEDLNGIQWTDLHQVMEQLFVLGIACEKVISCMPKKMWNALPGGMPYYTIT